MTPRSAWIVVGVSLLGATGCPGEYEQLSLSNAFVDSVSAGRVREVALASFPAPHIEFRLPDTVRFFSMEFPVALTGQGPPVCRIAIADQVDRAVHLFRTSGEYLRSYWEQRRPSPFASIASIDLDARGNLLISYLLSREIAIADSTGQVRSSWETSQLVDTMAPGAYVRGVGGERVAEHWFGVHFDTNSKDWVKRDLPLVRVFDYEGNELGRAGRVQAFPGYALTAAMNRGFIAAARDTIWYARASDARVWPIPMSGPKAYAMPDAPQVQFELFFTMEPPKDFRSRSRGDVFADVQEHLRGFTVTEDGSYFAAVQVVAWTVDSLRVTSPRTALLVRDRRDGATWVGELGEQIRHVATAGGMVYVVSRRPPDGEFRLRAWPLAVLLGLDVSHGLDVACL